MTFFSPVVVVASSAVVVVVSEVSLSSSSQSLRWLSSVVSVSSSIISLTIDQSEISIVLCQPIISEYLPVD